MDNYLLGNLDQQAAFGYDQFCYFDDQTLFSNGLSPGTDLGKESALNAPQAYYQPDAIQNPLTVSTSQNLPINVPDSDDQVGAYFVNSANWVEIAPASAEPDPEFENLDLKSLKNFFYNEDDETFLDNYLANYESDPRPETLNDYVTSGQPELPARFETSKPEAKSSLDDFIRTELVGVTEDFELNYELDAFELPPELNDRISAPECPPTPDLAFKSSKPRNQTKQRKLIRCNLCLYTSFDRHKIKRHYLTHSRAKPFSFGECGSSSTQSEALKTHFAKSHPAEPTMQFEPNTRTDFQRGPAFSGRQTNLNEQFSPMNRYELRANVEPNQMLSRDRLSCQINNQLSSRMNGLMNEQANFQGNFQANYQMTGGNPASYLLDSRPAINSFNNPVNSHQMTGQTNQTYLFNQVNQVNQMNQTNQSDPANFQAFSYYPTYQVQQPNSSLNASYPLGNHPTSRVMSNQRIGQFGLPENHQENHQENHLSMISQEYCTKIFDFMF